jgi:hypothetical protein
VTTEPADTTTQPAGAVLVGPTVGGAVVDGAVVDGAVVDGVVVDGGGTEKSWSMVCTMPFVAGVSAVTIEAPLIVFATGSTITF